MSVAEDAGRAVRAALAEQPSLATDLVEPPSPALLAGLVAPPLTAAQAAGLDLILEGFLLHHGRPRHLAPADPGRRVLAGDYCYAQGLVRVAAAGDLEVIEALADLVALSAALVADERREDLPALWRATAAAIAGEGGGELQVRVRAAKRALQAGDGAPMWAVVADLPPVPAIAEALR